MIESYDFGAITIDGKRYSRDVIIYPDRVDDGWWRREGHELRVEDIKEIVKQEPEVLVVGTGYHGYMKVLREVEAHLRAKGIELVADTTKKACERYNALSLSKRTVAALHLTC